MVRHLYLFSICIAVIAVCDFAHAGPVHQEGFESDLGDWVGYESVLSRESDMTDGIPSSEGGYHMVIADPGNPGEGYFSGAYSFLGGSRTSFNGGWGTSIDIYIDPLDSKVQAGAYGFDLSQAMYDTDGNHEQDNIFHVGAVDPNGDGQYSIFINASHNTGSELNPFVLTNSSQPYGSSEVPGQIDQAGWYTFNVQFSPSFTKPGFVEVSFTVADDLGNNVWGADWTTEDYFLTEAGGNGYLWFNYVSADKLAVDNVQMQVVPLPPSVAMLGLGLVGAGGFGWMRRRRR